MKKCNKCNSSKSNKSFGKSKKYKDGLKTICKSCLSSSSSVETFCSQSIGCTCGCMNSMSDGLTIAEREGWYQGPKYNY